MFFSLSAFATVGLVSMVAAADMGLHLPALTGPHAVGTVSVRMTDNSRKDPFAPTEKKRSILVQLYYPTSGSCKLNPAMKLAPYGPNATVDATGRALFPGEMADQVIPALENIMTQNIVNAPLDTSQKYPVVLFSPAYSSTHMLFQVHTSELASHGYIVAAMSHTYESLMVTFPDGEEVAQSPKLPPRPPGGPEFTTFPALVRQADSIFVLNELSSARAMKYIPGLKEPLDVSRCGMFGHSLGGATTAAVMANDTRVQAGINLDGAFQVGTDYLTDFQRPFTLFHAENHDAAFKGGDPTYGPFLKLQTGYKRHLNLTGAIHETFTDGPALVSLLGMPKEAAQGFIGTTDPTRVTKIVPKYIVDFFGFTLKKQGEGVMKGPSKEIPEVLFMD